MLLKTVKRSQNLFKIENGFVIFYMRERALRMCFIYSKGRYFLADTYVSDGHASKTDISLIQTSNLSLCPPFAIHFSVTELSLRKTTL